MDAATRPRPVPTEATRGFWDAARAHRLCIQRCAACAKTQFYPRAFCRHCMSDQVQWLECSGMGTVYTFTVNHRAANPHMADKLPYVVAIVELAEGTRMMANIVGCPPGDVRIGARVEVQFLDLDAGSPEGIALPQFRLSAP